MIFTYITQTHRWYNLINFYTLRTEIQNGSCEVSHSIFLFSLLFLINVIRGCSELQLDSIKLGVSRVV